MELRSSESASVRQFKLVYVKAYSQAFVRVVRHNHVAFGGRYDDGLARRRRPELLGEVNLDREHGTFNRHFNVFHRSDSGGGFSLVKGALVGGHEVGLWGIGVFHPQRGRGGGHKEGGANPSLIPPS